MFNHRKYQPFPAIRLTDRTWPDQVITTAPDWCSVDLRDGNQALVNPMSVEQKTRLFQLLVKLGFKEIEVGFPAASTPDFEFIRKLINENMIPDDVSVQVLTQARESLIARTFEALSGAKKAIVHVYNSTSTVQREQVFGMDCSGITSIAVQGARWIREHAARHPETDWTFQYSPESFTGTELEYAKEVCDAVINIWQPEQGQKVIINLPATVEMSTPNIFADQIEWFCRHLNQREHIRISLHTHNDRGCAVAAAELGLMAGADRVEGTLAGNGERTGNTDLITMAMNLYSQGVDPQLDLSDVAEIIKTIEYCTELPVPARHPWIGELVYTAFSGSHQDAIRKSMHYHQENNQPHWNVAYLPVDPHDLGREYEEVVRINSQSGKGGVALVLERDFGIVLPKWFHPEVAQVVQQAAEESGFEVRPKTIHDLYQRHFVHVPTDWQLHDYELHTHDHHVTARFTVGNGGVATVMSGSGSGVIEALCDALECQVDIEQFDLYAITGGTNAQAQACIAARIDHGEIYYGIANNDDSSAAALQAILTAVSHCYSNQSLEGVA
ncbi:2-isopropylmalate synthase [Endozoicomonadaceae bacterium StTr2]